MAWSQEPWEELAPAHLAPTVPEPTPHGVASPGQTAGGWFDTSNRASIRNLYLTVLAATRTTPTNWTGSLSSCLAGDISSTYKTAVTQRIDWMRGMAGVPTGITLNQSFNTKDQKAALIFSAQGAISHYPPSNWACYSYDGYEAAGKSNICAS